jgi:hypothetical protein
MESLWGTRLAQNDETYWLHSGRESPGLQDLESALGWGSIGLRSNSGAPKAWELPWQHSESGACQLWWTRHPVESL